MSPTKHSQRRDSAAAKQSPPRREAANVVPSAARVREDAALRAILASGSLTPRDVLRLQRAVGNRATRRLLAGARQPQAVQPKLVIGSAADKYEREADQIARQVVNRIHSPAARSSPQDSTRQKDELPTDEETFRPKSEPEGQSPESPPQIPALRLKLSPELKRPEPRSWGDDLQGSPTAQPPWGAVDEMTAAPSLEGAINRARGLGQPLADNVRVPMEQAFGADFRSVRVHTGEQSAELSSSIQARAFTLGQDIFFQQGEYAPESLQGRELLAHELTHVVQQGGAAVPRAQGGGAGRDAGERVSRFDDRRPAHDSRDFPVSVTRGGDAVSRAVIRRQLGYGASARFRLKHPMHPVVAGWATNRAHTADEAEQIYQVGRLLNTAAELDTLRAAANNNNGIILALLQLIGAPLPAANIIRLGMLMHAAGAANVAQLLTLIPAAGGWGNSAHLLTLMVAAQVANVPALTTMLTQAGGQNALQDLTWVLNRVAPNALRAMQLCIQAAANAQRFHIYRQVIPHFLQQAAPGVGAPPAGIGGLTAFLAAFPGVPGLAAAYRVQTPNLQHFLTRHVYDYFDFANADAQNSMWPIGTTAVNVATYIQEALTHHHPPPHPAAAAFPHIVAGGPANSQTAAGVAVQIGTYGAAPPRTIGQFFPLPNLAANNPANQVVTFTRAEMLAIEQVV